VDNLTAIPSRPNQYGGFSFSKALLIWRSVSFDTSEVGLLKKRLSSLQIEQKSCPLYPSLGATPCGQYIFASGIIRSLYQLCRHGIGVDNLDSPCFCAKLYPSGAALSEAGAVEPQRVIKTKSSMKKTNLLGIAQAKLISIKNELTSRKEYMLADSVQAALSVIADAK